MSTLAKIFVGDEHPKRAIIDQGAGDTAVVAAVSGKKIRVLSYYLVPAGSGVYRFESTAGGDALTGQMTPADGTPIAANFNPLGHFETNAGEPLNLEAATAGCDGHLMYIEV